MKRDVGRLLAAMALLVGCSDAPVTQPDTDVVVSTDTVTDTAVPHGCAADQCHINSVCYDSGAQDTVNPCFKCDASLNPSGWSPYSGAACDDGNACTENDTCQGSTCLPGSPVACDDGNPCTTDSCIKATGCVFEPAQMICDDGSECTVNDTCKSGNCVGTPKDCDDGNSCTTDGCEAATGCTHVVGDGAACLPVFDKINPGRGATIEGASGKQYVAVTGVVTSGGGAITQLLINGEEVGVSKQGDFSTTVDAEVGTNFLVFEATDADGNSAKRVQAYQWSTAYSKPDDKGAKSGIVAPGVSIWLSKDAIDDGTRNFSAPKNLGTLAELVLQGIDIGAMVPSPAGNADASALGNYDVFLKNITHDPAQVTVTPMAGKMKIKGLITNLNADFKAEKTCGFLDGCVGPGAITGTVDATEIDLSVELILSVVDHEMVAEVKNVSVNFDEDDVTIDVDGFFGWLVEWILGFFKDDLADTLKAEVQTVATEQLGPLLASALEGFVIDASFDVPYVFSDDATFKVDLLSDFDAVSVKSQGASLSMRAAAYSDAKTPHMAPTHRGAPLRVGCGAGNQTLTLNEGGELEVAIADDLLNSLLYSAWRGGMLEFDVPPSLFEDIDLDSYGVSDLTLQVSGLLAPTISDCGPNQKSLLQVGDLKITSEATFMGTQIPLEVWASFALEVGVEVEDSVCQTKKGIKGCSKRLACEEAVCAENPSCCTIGWDLTCSQCAQGVDCPEASIACGPRVTFSFGGFTTLETELHVTDEDLFPLEELVTAIVETQLIPKLPEVLVENGPISFPLPQMDVGGLLPGIPAGTKLGINPKTVIRNQGTTLVTGEVK